MNKQKDMKGNLLKYYNIFMISVWIFALIVMFYQSHLFEANIGIILFLETTTGYTIGITIICIISFIISFLFTYPKIFYNPLDEYNKESNRNRIIKVSNDILFVIFLFGWITYGIYTNFRESTDVILDYFYQYLWFIIVCFAFIPLIKIYELYKAIKLNSREEYKLIDFGDKSEYLKPILWGIVGFILITLISFPLSAFGNITAIFTEEGRDFLLFQLLASIPFEELYFRGFIILILTTMVREIVFDISRFTYKIKKKKFSKKRSDFDRYIMCIIIAVSSIIFGLMHKWRYGDDFQSISYLIIFGTILGLINWHYGLLSAYIAHALNNLASSFTASLFPNISVSPVNIFSLLIIGAIIGIIAKNIQKKQSEHKFF